MRKGGFEPPRLYKHHPLKMACLPIPPHALNTPSSPLTISSAVINVVYYIVSPNLLTKQSCTLSRQWTMLPVHPVQHVALLASYYSPDLVLLRAHQPLRGLQIYYSDQTAARKRS